MKVFVSYSTKDMDIVEVTCPLDWMRERLLLDVPHRQVVFTIPKMLRIFFKYKRRLMGDL